MRTHRSISTRLVVEPLEGREVPAGSITASLTHGKLSITGDDQANGLTVLVAPGSVTLTPDASTTVNGQPAGTAVTFSGTATSLTANLAGGDDTLSIDGSSDFVLTGAAAFNLGDGDNELVLATSGHVTLGSLSVTSGDGTNFVVVDPGVGLGTVTGAANFRYGNGSTVTLLSETKFLGPTGLKITVPASGASAFHLTDVTVSKGFSADVGNEFLGPPNTIDSSSLGGLTLTGFRAAVNVTDSTVTGDVKVAGGFYGSLYTYGTFAARNVTVTGSGAARLEVGGTTATIGGNVTVGGGLETGLVLQSSGPTEVRGNVSLNGGSVINQVAANGQFTADKNVTITGRGDTLVGLGDGSAPLNIGGNLSIRTGNGQDEVVLLGVNAAQNTSISTGSGGDRLTIDDGSSFTGTFAANLGSGDDQISIAQNSGQSAPVTFSGKTTVLAGNGDDTLSLGAAPANGGDANSKAVFTATGDKIDGGANYNTFDGLTPGQAPSQYTGLTAANFLHWTDPNP